MIDNNNRSHKNVSNGNTAALLAAAEQRGNPMAEVDESTANHHHLVGGQLTSSRVKQQVANKTESSEFGITVRDQLTSKAFNQQIM